MKVTTLAVDPFAGVHAATREHQHRHGCGAYTHHDGTLPAAIAAAADGRRIVEVGTALGYTACWLATATATSTTTVDTIEFDADHVRLAREQISFVGLADRITVHHGDADDVLISLPAGEFDVAFFDGFAPTTAMIAGLRTRLRVGGILLAANLTLRLAERYTAFLAS